MLVLREESTPVVKRAGRSEAVFMSERRKSRIALIA
jgi:hypothetical protein